MTKMRGIRRAACPSLACLGFALAIVARLPPAVAETVYDAAAVVGQWDLSLGDTNQTCRVTLEAEAGDGGRLIEMPAICRHSLPILAKVGAWNVPETGRIDLADASGKPVLDFVAKSDDSLSASGPKGETYELVAVDAAGKNAKFDAEDVSKAPGFELVQAAPLPSDTAPPAGSAPMPGRPRAPASKPVPPVAPPPKPSAAALAMKPSDLAGRYSLEREGGKDTGCMLTLNDQAKAAGGNKATLAPACRDQGVLIFDPAGWRLANGRLVLIARRGFTTHLDLQANGTWLKDPKDGKPLILKKM